MRHPANHIFEHTPDSLREWCLAKGMKPFRAAQILEWVYRKQIIDPAAMSNLSPVDRAALAREVTFLSGDIVKQQSASDGVQKLLIEWSDPEPAPDAAHVDQPAEVHASAEPTGLASRLRIAGQ